MARVEATTARVEPWPVRTRKAVLQEHHAPEVGRRQEDGERGVDEGAVYDHVYVVETIPQDGGPNRHGETGEGEGHEVLDDAGVHHERKGGRDAQEVRRGGEPLDLLALFSGGTLE